MSSCTYSSVFVCQCARGSGPAVHTTSLKLSYSNFGSVSYYCLLLKMMLKCYHTVRCPASTFSHLMNRETAEIAIYSASSALSSYKSHISSRGCLLEYLPICPTSFVYHIFIFSCALLPCAGSIPWHSYTRSVQ